MTNIDALRAVIMKLHGAQATHLESVPVHEQWEGQTVWRGIVEVFELRGHSETTKAYGWAHETDDPHDPIRYVTVLHVPPATTPQMAVRASIAKDYYASK